MPYSSTNGKAHIKRIVSSLPHHTILDIGCGRGAYRDLFPDADMTGVEAWLPYLKEFNLRERYQRVFAIDARFFEPEGRFDVCILGDVLEHMSEEDARSLHAKALEWADTVVLSIPIGYYPQGDGVILPDGREEHNPLNVHITDHWTVESVKTAFGKPDWWTVEGEIGVFVWSKHSLKKLKIAIYAIAKNEEKFVERFYESCKEADWVVIADTGSTDATRDRLAELPSGNTIINRISVRPWRFDVARNASLALVPDDVDVCMCADLDEVLQLGWREEIERIWTPGVTRMFYMFDWGLGFAFLYDKIHARHGYRWRHPCHELLHADPRIKEVHVSTSRLMLVHKPDPTKSRGQYMELLDAAMKEDSTSPRTAFYHARELTFYRRWDEAIVALSKYLEMDGGPNERSYAMRLIGSCYKELGNLWEAERWYLRACGEGPGLREPWCDLAMVLYQQHRWLDCYQASMRALTITNREPIYTIDPAVWAHWAHDLASVSAWNLGLYDVAEEQAVLAVEKTPDDPRLVNNLAAIRRDRPDRKLMAAE
jgi:tetratricopeptide (TPR) repeat protein